MNSKIQKVFIGGIIGTAAMTMVMFMAPLLGFPKMNTVNMLSAMIGFPVFVGLIMHFMIGIIFAFSYAFLFSKLVGKISNPILKGSIFGLAVFVFLK
jgi:uncharacterized membrane protein YagU involved in acid resistance